MLGIRLLLMRKGNELRDRVYGEAVEEIGRMWEVSRALMGDTGRLKSLHHPHRSCSTPFLHPLF